MVTLFNIYLTLNAVGSFQGLYKYESSANVTNLCTPNKTINATSFSIDSALLQEQTLFGLPATQYQQSPNITYRLYTTCTTNYDLGVEKHCCEALVKNLTSKQKKTLTRLLRLHPKVDTVFLSQLVLKDGKEA
jgi:hypothetical protein